MISINVNPAASGAGLNLGKANEALQKSLSRLSSGRRIVTSSDDAGGLAVSMKMAAAQKRTEATAINLRNMVSFLDTQDGAFKVADKVVSRMSELAALSRDVSKNSGDIENYDKEFSNLKLQMMSLATEKFNGVPLFDASTEVGKVFTVPTSEDGSQTTSVTQAGLASDPMIKMMNEGFHTFEIEGNKFITPFSSDITASTGFTAYQIPGGVLSPVELTGTFDTTGTPSLTVQVTGIMTVAGTPPIPSQSTITSTGGSVAISRASTSVLDATDIDDFVQIENSSGQTVRNTTLNYSNSDEYAFLTQEALQQLADMRAQNGAEMSRINFAQDLLNINAVNLEAANSRIMDVDVAAESSQLARFQILQQAGTAMLAQANTSQQSLVRLLQG
ncbi:MAG: flagellin [Verrucomicrobia bacterium]|jgi:flagellin-like hook-associated protein FlgL|nr:flagellin [Verrucomicrobiota bacterium]